MHERGRERLVGHGPADHRSPYTLGVGRPDRAKVIGELREHFQRCHGDAAAVWVFGSVARGTARATSDVDIGVLHAGARPSTLEAAPFDLEADLERLLGLPVQVVDVSKAPADLVHRILRDGILVFEGDRGRRVGFEVGARNEYFDLLPYLQRYRRPAGETRGKVEEQLVRIEACVRELRGVRTERIAHDVRERRFLEHTLQIAIQAALDVASHIVSDERLGEPTTNRELFELLAAAGWIDESLRDTLRRMVGLRNVLVHGYTKVDPLLFERAVTHHLDDLLAYVAAVRARLE